MCIVEPATAVVFFSRTIWEEPAPVKRIHPKIEGEQFNLVPLSIRIGIDGGQAYDTCTIQFLQDPVGGTGSG
jgi:hypothetical protein